MATEIKRSSLNNRFSMWNSSKISVSFETADYHWNAATKGSIVLWINVAYILAILFALYCLLLSNIKNERFYQRTKDIEFIAKLIYIYNVIKYRKY